MRESIHNENEHEREKERARESGIEKAGDKTIEREITTE